MRVHFKPLPILSLASIATLGLLIWLGNWQWRRFEDKTAARAVPAEIVKIAAAPDIEKAVFVFGVRDGQQGWRVFAPVALGARIAFVDLAFWPGLEPPHSTFCFLREEVRGVWASPRRASAFHAPNNVRARLFYSIALPEMARSVDIDAVEPRYLAADYGPEPNPFVGDRDPLPPARHLGYAITWWGLACGLIGVYLVFHSSRGRFRVRFGPKRDDNGAA